QGGARDHPATSIKSPVINTLDTQARGAMLAIIKRTAALRRRVLMRTFWKDIQFAMRTLAKSPGFAVIAIVTLALGMAVTTTIFSVINGILLRPLPVPHAEQITVLAMKQDGAQNFERFSYSDYLDIRQQAEVFSDVFAERATLVGLTADKKGDHCVLSRVTGNYFSALGVHPAVGR